MASFLQRAKDKAHEAAQQIQQTASNYSSGGQHHSSTTASSSTSTATAGAGSGSGGLSSSTYTSSLPHLLRHGIASIDPRLQSNRSFHLFNNASKAVSIDHEALARETHAFARATYSYGQDHIPSNRLDGGGDEAIADVTDRVAYVLSLTGDLHSQHVARIEGARKLYKSTLLAAPLESSELLARRTKRLAIVKELQQMAPEKAKAPSSQSPKLKELEESLRKLEVEDKAAEESAGHAKRVALRKEMETYFDSVIELAERLAVAARYGKLLAQELPTAPNVDPIRFPADRVPHDRSREAVWSGAVRVAEIRAAVGPAVNNLQVDKTNLPVVPHQQQPGAQTPFSDSAKVSSATVASLGRSDTVSYGVSHAADLKADAAVHEGVVGGHERVQPSDDGTSASRLSAPAGMYAELSGSPGSQHQYGSSPSNVSGLGHLPPHAHSPAGPLAAKINMQPIDIPLSPSGGSFSQAQQDRRSSSFGSPPPVPGRPQQHRVPPLPGQMSHSPSSTSGSNLLGSPVLHPSHLGPHGDDVSTTSLHSGSPAAHPPPASGGADDGSNPYLAPDEPTVAETGAPIVGQGGPKTGYLPRRSSQAVHGASPGSKPSVSAGSSFGAPVAGAGAASGAGTSSNYFETTSDARQRKEAEAERERQAQAAAGQAQGQDDLPPYSERGLK